MLRERGKDPLFTFHSKCVKIQLTHLIFADDLMIFTRGDLPSVKRGTQVLLEFSKRYGFMPNFDKTAAYFGGTSPELRQLILEDSGLTEGSFPFRYLGLPINHGSLSFCMFDGLVTKLKTLSTSRASKFLYYARKLQVINSMLFGLVNFWCSRFLLPKSICKHIDTFFRQIFWGYAKGHHKMIFKNWSSICTPLSEGGLNIKNFHSWNLANMLKWLWLLYTGIDSIWVTWINHYFLSGHTIWDISIYEYFAESLRGVLLARDLLLNQVGDVSSTIACRHSRVVRGSFFMSKAYDLLKHKSPPHRVYKSLNCDCILPHYKVILTLAHYKKSYFGRLKMATDKNSGQIGD
ncbi:uncharacterized protein LOC141640902 [Silene latifolia]|uniref:uncharacterized protein LOC141640902 n=1 Tax=Silene latifolia TaxID=37657 RepID=UPI003D78131D